jgi:hypothetical protein
MVTLVTEPVSPTPTLPKLTELLLKQIAGNSAVPTPVRFSVVKPPAASSAITRGADRPPAARGANDTLIVQVPPTASGPPVQLCVTKKSFDAKPVAVTLAMFSADEPQLVIVMLCTVLVVVSNWLPKLSVPAPELRQTTGTAGVPKPLSGTMRGLPVASSVMTSWAVRFPLAVGENAIFTLQFLPGDSGPPTQLWDTMTKSAAFKPPMLALEIPMGVAAVLFWYVTLCTALVSPIGSLGNTSEGGVTEIVERVALTFNVSKPPGPPLCGSTTIK